MPPASPNDATGRTTAKERYDALLPERTPFLERARSFAKLTIPTLIPDEGANGHTTFVQSFQSFGAKAVNNLASKFLLALFPPNTPFFRFNPEDEVVEAIEASGAQDAKGEIEEALRKAEGAILRRLEVRGARRTLHELLKHLIVAGNVCLDILDSGGMRLHPLSRYVVKRDGEGNPFEVVTLETLDRRTLPASVLALLPETPETDAKQNQPVELYTRAVLEDGKWRVAQEVEGTVIPDSVGTYPKDSPPLIPLRWTKQDGCDYARSHVEDHSGDLRSLESLSKSITQLAAALAKILVFVDENGVTSLDDVANAESLDVLPGNAKDVTALQLEKSSDLRVAKEQAADLKRELAGSFLLTSSVQRDAERVTAEEIRLLAGELEQAHGGPYSVLAQELQYPLVSVYLTILRREKKIKLPAKFVTTSIVTGLEALGRNSEAQKMELVVTQANAMFGPETAKEYFNVPEMLRRFGTAYGIELKGLLKTPEELADQQSQAIASQMALKAAPQLAAAAPGQAAA